MKRNNESIRYRFTTRLMVGLALLTLVPVITMSLFTNLFTNRLMMKSARKQTSGDLANAVNHFDSIINTYISSVKTLSVDESLVRLLRDKPDTQEASSMVYEKLYLIMGDRRSELSMFVLSKDNTFSVSTVQPPEQYNLQLYDDWGIFRKIKSNRSMPVAFPNVYINILGEKIVLSLGAGIYSGDELLGYIILDIPETVMQSILKANDSRYRHVAYTQNGLIVYNDALAGSTHNFVYSEMLKLLGTHENEVYQLGNSRFCLARATSSASGLSFLAMQSLDYLDYASRVVNKVVFAVVSASVLLCLVTGYLYTRSLTRPIKQIVKTIKQIEKGNLDLRINLNRDDEFGFVADRFDEAIQSLRLYYQHDLERQDRLRLAELKALQSQINPHFLYNTLDSVKWLAKLNNVPEIYTIITELGRLLKSSMDHDTTENTLEESLRLIESYIGIQLIRHKNRFDYKIDLEDSIRDYPVPKLLLQPLVENAIVHGMEQCMHKVFIHIRAYTDGDYVYIIVQDNGAGMDKKWEDLKGEEIALKNIDRRIKLFYGPQYGLHIEGEPGKGTTVTLKLPRDFPPKEERV